MPKVRRTAFPNPGPIGRKRTQEASSPAGPSKRRLDANSQAARLSSREESPTKNVRFGRNLIQGPSGSDPDRRSHSPSRSALHRSGLDSDAADAQLLAEHRRAQTSKAPRRKRQSLPTEAGVKLNVLKSDLPLVGDTEGTTETLKSQIRNKEVATATQQLLDRLDQDPLFHGPRDQPEVFSESSDEATQPNGRPTLIGTGRGDEWVCEKINQLTSMIRDFAQSFPPVSTHRLPDVLDQLLKRENDQLIRYIGCLGIGGKDGMQGWQRLLGDTTCRQALVSGIIGRALKEKVFGELLFGAPDEIAEMLSKMEYDQAQQDGFFRTKKRSEAIIKHRTKWTKSRSLPEADARLTMQLERMLLPLWNQGGSTTTWKNSHKRTELARTVGFAADLSRNMREDRDVIYYWPPTFKDEEFEPARMECFNLYEMIQDSPYDKKSVNGTDRAILRAGHENESEAIVRVVCFPGLVAYRQGGGDLARQQLAEESHRPDNAPPDVRYQRKRLANRGPGELTGNEGFRTKVICKSVVLLQWGKQRLLTKEAGTSAHLDAKRLGKAQKYQDDYEGFVELYDVYRRRFPEPIPDTSDVPDQPSPQQDSPARSSWSDMISNALWRPRSRSRSAEYVPSGVSDAAANMDLSERRPSDGRRPSLRGKR